MWFPNVVLLPPPNHRYIPHTETQPTGKLVKPNITQGETVTNRQVVFFSLLTGSSIWFSYPSLQEMH